MVQRIDANTEDVVENVEGAQRELMKYWSRVSGNRWLVAKMFGVLMVIDIPLVVYPPALTSSRYSSSSGFLSLDEISGRLISAALHPALAFHHAWIPPSALG